MGGVGREVKVGLKSPLVERLKFVNKCGCHSSGDIGKPGCVDRVGSKQDTEEYRRFAIRIWPEGEPNLTDFADVQQLGRFRHSFPELRLVCYSSGDVHTIIIARWGWVWEKRFGRAVL
jgi:hypothetical protein